MSVIAPPFAIPEGQRLVYCYAGTTSGFGSANSPYPIGNVTASKNTCECGLTLSNPLAQQSCTVNWSNYYVPPVLYTPGTVVHGIYPYMVYNGGIFHSNWTVKLDGTNLSGLSGTVNTSYYFNANTTNLANVNGMTSSVFGEATLPIGAIADGFNVTFVAIAVYASIPYFPPQIRTNYGVGNTAD